MVWNLFFVFASSMWLVSPMETYYHHPTRGYSVWGYFTPPLLQRLPPQPRQTPMEVMVDLTNNLGIAILQDHAYSKGNFAFSPYGVASVVVVLYEGARGESARQMHRAVGFPSDKDVIRIGFRDVHRHLRSYFSHEGYLSGISLNKECSTLKPEYKQILRFYGYDVDLNQTFDEEYDTEKPSPALSEATKTPDKETPVVGTTAGVSNKNSTTPPQSDGEKGSGTTTAPTNPLANDTKPYQNTTKLEETTPAVEEAVLQNTTDRVTQQTVSPASVLTTAAELPNEEKNAGSIAPTENTTATSDPTESVKSTALPTEKIKTTTVPTGDIKTNAISEENLKTTTMTVENTKTTAVPTENIKTTATATEDIKTTTVPTDNTKITITPSPTVVTELPNDYTTEPVATTETAVDDFQMHLTTDANSNCEGDMQSSEGKAKGCGVKTTTENVEWKPNGDESSDPPTDSEVVGTENEKPEDNSDLDNGMLIPQAGDLPTTTATGEWKETELETTPTAEESTIREQETSEAEDLMLTKRETTLTSGEPVSGSPELEKLKVSESVETTTETPNADFEDYETTSNLLLNADTNLPKRVQESSGTGTSIRNLFNARIPLWLNMDMRKSKRPTPRIIRTITDYLKSPRTPDLSLQLQNGMYDTHVSRNADLYRSLPRLLFLVDGAIDTPVPMMTYTSVFPFAYIPKLHAKALEFPLDDPRYKLLLVLPVERRGLRQLIYDLLDYPLRNVLESLNPARVRTVVPTFMVEGFVILTSSLQKLGISDVFDPRKANLSGMSVDPELYVRNVEQSVTVVIRNYVEIFDIQTRTMAARHLEHEFEVTHPFLYFVLDTATNVALIAGQMLDPLNSRIY